MRYVSAVETAPCVSLRRRMSSICVCGLSAACLRLVCGLSAACLRLVGGRRSPARELVDTDPLRELIECGEVALLQRGPQFVES